MRRFGVGWVVLLAACGPAVNVDDGAQTSSTTGDGPGSTAGPTTTPTSTSADTTVGTSVGTTDPTTVSTTGDPTIDPTDDDVTTEDPGCAFIGCDDFGGDDGGSCDVWAQDCLPGERCMPWANDGTMYWNSVRCSPDLGEAEVGEACMVEGSAVSGIDDCPLGAMCLFVDPATNLGECVANCEGSWENPQCADPNAVCQIAFDGVMINCLPSCDPILQDCAQGACYSDLQGTFACGPTYGDGLAVGEPCYTPWDCTTGSTCIDQDLLPDCVDVTCCSAFCDLTMPDTCSEGLSCTPWYEEGQAPPGLERVGICAAL